MSIIIFDTETTGLLLPSSVPLNEQPRIIELGALKIDFSGNQLGMLSQLINPGVEIEPKITKITGIKNEDLIGRPSFSEYLENLKIFFSDATMMICHNANFDVSMLKLELRRCECNDFNIPKNIICTVQEYYSSFGYRPSLKVLYQRHMRVPLQQTHRALDDAKALNEILMKDNFYDSIQN